MAEKKAKIAKEAKEPKTPKAAKAKVVEEVSEEVIERSPEELPQRPVGNYVYVGKKGVMAYVLAVITQFNAGAKEVTLKARGQSISRAVDVEQIIRNKSPEVHLKSILTSTEEVTTDDGRPLKVSAIEIVLSL